MSENSLFASICNFFNGLFASEEARPSSTTPSNKTNDDVTGVERYIRSQADKNNQVTGVESFVRSQPSAQNVTGVEKYIRNQTNAQKMTGVESYIRNQD